MSGGNVENAVMQVLGTKKVTCKSGDKERHRLLLSDGLNCISFAMLSTQVAQKEDMPQFSIIKILKYITSLINNVGSKDKRVLVILEFELIALGDVVKMKIGNPEQLSDNVTTPSSAIKPNNSTSSAPTPQQTLPGHSTNLDEPIHPIASLSPYHNKWAIKARVTNKSALREWNNSRSQGKVMNWDVADESGEIRFKAFNELAEQYSKFLEVDKVYLFSKGRVQIANKQYNPLKNDYEISVTKETIIQECDDEDVNIPQTQFNFLQIDKIANIEVNSFIDIIGVCKSCSDVVTIQARSTGREMKKRELNLVDQSNTGITLTLWGTDAENFNGAGEPIIALRGAKVGEFGGGKNLSMISSTTMKINPDLPESHRLRGWFDNMGNQVDVTNISARSGGNFQANWMSFKEVQDSGLGNSDKGDYFQTKATIVLMKTENCLYKACPSDQCNKKVVDMENGMYRCEKCNREYPNFKYRLLLSMNLGDWSGNQWVNTFASEAEKILGITSQELGEAIEQDPEALTNTISMANFSEFVFRCRTKMETYNDEARLKTVVVKVDNINYKEYNAHLISRIQQLSGVSV